MEWTEDMREGERAEERLQLLEGIKICVAAMAALAVRHCSTMSVLRAASASGSPFGFRLTNPMEGEGSEKRKQERARERKLLSKKGFCYVAAAECVLSLLNWGYARNSYR